MDMNRFDFTRPAVPGQNLQHLHAYNQQEDMVQLPFDLSMNHQMGMQHSALYSSFKGPNFGGMLPYDSHPAKMLQYFRTVAAPTAHLLPRPHQLVKPQVSLNPPVPHAPHHGSSVWEKTKPDLSMYSMQEIARNFDVYVPEATMRQAEKIVTERRTGAKKLATFLLREIITDDVIVTQSGSGGRVYKAADPNILNCVEAMVNSRFKEREKHINIYSIFTNLSSYLRQKRHKASKSVESSATSNYRNPASSQLKRILVPEVQSNPPPTKVQSQTYAQGPNTDDAWKQPPPAKRANIPTSEPPSVPLAVSTDQRVLNPNPNLYHHQPAAQGAVQVNQPQWQQYYMTQHPYYPFANSRGIPPNNVPLSPYSLETTSMSSGGSEFSSPSKTDSPDSMSLNICDDFENSEILNICDDFGAKDEEQQTPARTGGGGLSQGSYGMLSQEYWDYQSQQGSYYES